MDMHRVIMSLTISIFFAFTLVSAAPLVDPAAAGVGGQSLSANYDALMGSLFADGRVVTTVGDDLWVPWYKTSSSSQVSDLQGGANCDAGQPVDATHNCMVTDEFSQVGVLVAMGNDEARMRQFFNTVLAIPSTNGNLPSWRVYRNGDAIEACRPGINGNCDSASDADARIVIALYTASQNPLFTDETMKAEYADYATSLADDMLAYEVDHTCRPTAYGEVCHWLAGGSSVKRGGLASSDYAYTGYYPDAIIAMLAAYAHTGQQEYLDAAQDFTLNYLQAARFDGQDFSVPAGKSFKWVIDAAGQPQAQCTNTCSPPMWDGFDASRALGMCQAKYYADEMGVELPQLSSYCDALQNKHMADPTRAPLQFYPDGTAVSYQSGYFAQGLEALHLSGVSPSLFARSLGSALSHYSVSAGTFDNEPAMGVYTKAFVVRALGMGIGRDLPAFTGAAVSAPAVPDVPPVVVDPAPAPDTAPSTDGGSVSTGTASGSSSQAASGIASLAAFCADGAGACALVSDEISGVCRTIRWDAPAGVVQVQACEKDGGFVEVYRQEHPGTPATVACVDEGCVDDLTGFARFVPSGVAPAPSQDVPVNDSPAPVPVDTSTPAPAPYDGVASLAASCGADGCSLVSDGTSGVCRTIRWDAPAGVVQVQACEKDGGFVEVYRQEFPAGAGFSACVGDGCVDALSGFARFSPAAATQDPVQVTGGVVQSPAPSADGVVVSSGNDGGPVSVVDQQVQEPVPAPSSVDAFGASCSAGADGCSLVSDGTSGVCRTIRWDSPVGAVQVQACEKDDGYIEVYRQSLPSGSGVSACLGDACVDDYAGFAALRY